MKPVLSLLAVATAALAASPAAEVFIFDPAVPTTEAPRISKEVARLVFAHRLRDTPDETSPVVPSSVSARELDSQINAYGKPRQSLFSSQRTQREPQLVVLVEGATSESVKDVRAALDGASPAFSVSNPPSQSANHDLLASDFADFTGPWVGPNSCPIDLAVNPNEARCWDGDSLVVKYDATKEPETISLLASSIPKLQKWAASGELETTLIILPESSRNGDIGTWASENTPKLGRRQESETVMRFNTEPSEAPKTIAADARVSSSPVEFFSSGHCFATQQKCTNSTYGCFRHGTCEEVAAGCFKCACSSTKDEYGVVTDWTGAMCQKADVSTEFWMFFGVGIVALLSIGGALSLLTSVGNEPLPGVLGAGVVRSK